jgi:uncharacterized membrane protein
LSEAQFAEIIMTIIAIPIIMIISFYLLACSIAPIVDLNNQTFKVIFTLAAGVPTLLFYLKKQI